VESPEGADVQAEPVQLQSQHINCGMSGAGVLDADRNLVVGIVSETWFPDRSTRDRDTAWAVNARVLSLDPLNLPTRDDPLPKGASLRPRTDLEQARLAVASNLEPQLDRAPGALDEWVGREDLLTSLTADWADPDRSVTGLIGFGGEGKSSLARRWIDELLADETDPKPDGVFWWGFYEHRNVDEFFEAALNYLSGGSVDARRYASSSAKAHLIAGMLYAGRYLFVLDGLEVMQHPEGDRYGLLQNNDLRDLLSYAAAPGHASFCLVTSRAPLLDLMAYTSYAHRDVARLSAVDGRALLRKLGVCGDDRELDRAVAAWDGHALTLSLLGALLAERYDGDVARLDELPPPTADEPRYERVHRVLRRYDEHLTDAERAFLMLFSAFRTPVHESAFETVFRTETDHEGLNAPIAALDDAGFDAMIDRMVARRILRRHPKDRTYTTHPLIRNYYFARLTAGECDGVQDAHQRIKNHYLDLAGDTPTHPTLDDLAPLIEVVHHACLAGAYDEAFRIHRDSIDQRNRYVLTYESGAYETALALMGEFFPDGDTSQEPRVTDPEYRGWILNTVGGCLMSLGALADAAPFFERGKAMVEELEDWTNASAGYQNLAGLYAYLGALEQSAAAADEALTLARRAENERNERDSLVRQAWTAHLRGEADSAGALFAQAEALEREIDPIKRHLYGLRGIQHADHLRRAGDAGNARRVTEANLGVCERNRWPDDLSRCHRVLGDLTAAAGDDDGARDHYDEALKIARSISVLPALIEALLGRGRWSAQCLNDADAAFADLNEALGYTVDGGYRIYEADARIALAWAHRAANDAVRACDEADRARGMSLRMGYHWGRVDAQEILDVLDS